MVVVIGVVAVVATGGAAAPIVAEALVVAEGVGAGAGAAATVATTTGAVVGGSAAAAGVVAAEVGTIGAAAVSGAAGGGAIALTTGTCVTTGVVGGAVGEATIATTAAVIGGGSAVAEGAAIGTAAALTNPVGWFILGASQNQNLENYTWDCWKPLLHDESKQKSKGRLLKDVLCDDRIQSVVSYGLSSGDPSKCSFIVKNIWNETFEIKPVIFHDGNVAFHATIN